MAQTTFRGLLQAFVTVQFSTAIIFLHSDATIHFGSVYVVKLQVHKTTYPITAVDTHYCIPSQFKKIGSRVILLLNRQSFAKKMHLCSLKDCKVFLAQGRIYKPAK